MHQAQKIREALTHTLRTLRIEVPEIQLDQPTELKNGDFATGIALQCAKSAGIKPLDLAKRIAEGLGDVPGIAKIEVAGPGFINFYVTSFAVSESIEEARTNEKWGANSLGEGQTVMVEYTDPNPFKEFHIGHLMSNAIGEAFTRLLQFMGAKVIRVNYQGDIGLHVAKALYVLLEKGAKTPTAQEIGAAYVEGANRYEENEEDKKKIDELNKAIYQRTNEAAEILYQHGRAVCLEEFEKIYKILGTKFDHYFFESETGPIGLELVKSHPEIFEESEGAIVFKGEKYDLHTRVFVNKMGLPTYEAKEVGLAQMKNEYAECDRSIYVTASEQTDYFYVVKKAIELTFPEMVGKIEHRAHGMMRFAEGKMSSRKGNTITGASLLSDLSHAAAERAKESRADNVDHLAEQVAVAAVKYQVLKQQSGRDIIFNREQALSLEGDSGPYLQYAHARTCAVVEKASAQGVTAVTNSDIESNEVARLLIRFPYVVERAAKSLEPQLVANYLIHFAAAFNSWYAQEQILDGTPGAAHKVALVDAVRMTLRNGLWLLGIPAPEKM